MLEENLESPLGCKEIQPVHPKGDQSWVFIGRTDVEAETPILWPPDGKSWPIWKDPDSGKDWWQERKAMTEDEMLDGAPTQWTWVWVNSGSWWWTGRPGVLQSIGSQRVGHNWATGLNWTELTLSTESLFSNNFWSDMKKSWWLESRSVTITVSSLVNLQEQTSRLRDTGLFLILPDASCLTHENGSNNHQYLLHL